MKELKNIVLWKLHLLGAKYRIGNADALWTVVSFS